MTDAELFRRIADIFANSEMKTFRFGHSDAAYHQYVRVNLPISIKRRSA